MKTFVIHTHPLVWFLAGDARLGQQAGQVLRDPDVRLIIPSIVLAEIKYLGHKGRFDQTLDDVLMVIGNDPRCLIYPIDLDVIRKMPLSLDIHDGLIVGTALAQLQPVEGVVTRDEEITNSAVVTVVW
jgi:PIN domain nuclease of toxin-antitoxin system